MSTPISSHGTSRAGERLALVTGGSRGLGHALCDELRNQGYTVLALSRTTGRPGSTAIDLADPVHSAATVRALLRDHDLGRIRDFIFLNNAATIEPVGPVARVAESALLRSLQINLVSAVGVIASVLAMVQASTARKVLVNVTSGAAQTAHAGVAAYGAAKAGMEHFIRCVALEQSRCEHPTLAINVDPGALDTDMQARLRAADPDDYPSRADFMARHARGELASPATVAAAIVQMARSDGLVPGARYRVRDHA